MKRILIAGIGNIFFGDDAFGCELVRALSARELPAEVTVIDFGVRGYDLAYALTEEYDAVILADAARCGGVPGTTNLIEVDLHELPRLGSPILDAHSLDPVQALQTALTIGQITARVFVMGCEPAAVEREGGELGLSAPVQNALPQAINLIESLVARLLAGDWKGGEHVAAAAA